MWPELGLGLRFLARRLPLAARVRAGARVTLGVKIPKLQPAPALCECVRDARRR